MAYTRAWSTAIPGNTDPVDVASDLSKLRVDITERMDTILGSGNWDNDPIVDLVSSIPLYVHWTQFSGLSTAVTWTVTNGSIQPNSGVTLYAPVIIPRGVTVTELRVFGNGTGTITLTLEEVDATSGTPTTSVLATAARSTASYGYTSSGTISQTINSTSSTYKYYYLKAVLTNGSSVFTGAELLFTRNGLDKTI